MRVLYLTGDLAGEAERLAGPDTRGRLVAAVSDFDGLYGRRRRLAINARAVAADSGALAVAVIPWPQATRAGSGAADDVRLRFTSLAERLALLEQLASFDAVIVAPISSGIAGATREAQATDALDLPGALWRGLSAIGDIATLLGAADDPLALALAPLAQSAGSAVELLAPLDEREATTAPQLQRLIAAGAIDEVTRRLSHAYMLSGEVIAGDARGRQLGFPTANMRPDPQKPLPAHGIYAVRVALPGEPEPWRPAVTSVGVRPTFGESLQPLVETYLFDTAMDLYGLTLRVAFVAKLREEWRFTSVEALIDQMALDTRQARAILAQGAETGDASGDMEQHTDVEAGGGPRGERTMETCARDAGS